MEHHDQHSEVEYITTFQRRLTLLLARNGAGQHTGDIVSTETVRLFENITAIMAKYPDPAGYAQIRATGDRALVDYIRHDNAQRGRGALGGREVIDGESAVICRSTGTPLGTAFDVWDLRLSETHDEFTAHLERSDQRDLLRAALVRLPADQREVLLLVDGYGYTVTEAAAAMGIARETAARKRSAAKRTLDHATSACQIRLITHEASTGLASHHSANSR